MVRFAMAIPFVAFATSGIGGGIEAQLFSYCPGGTAQICNDRDICTCHITTTTKSSMPRDHRDDNPNPNPKPTPEPTPKPEPKPREVCDGGARDCNGDEKPTGTEDDPTGYL